MRRLFAIIALAAAALALLASTGQRWNAEQRALIGSLGLSQLEPMPRDPSNRFADDSAAASLGRRLFFDTLLSANGRVSCGTCHDPARNFQDGTPVAQGVGVTDRRTMPVASTAWNSWQFWDGRKDSQWSQALGPLESAVEHGGTRTFYVHEIARRYARDYQAVFGALPVMQGLPRHAGPAGDSSARAAWQRLGAERQDAINRAFANIGKAIAAFERRVQVTPSRFDRYAAQVAAGGRGDGLSEDEERGLALFIGKGQCVNCHNGALFTDQHFHNTGVPARAGRAPDRGRAAGERLVLADEFNCRGRYSDARAGACAELEFLATGSHEMEGAMKTPSLRNVAERAPFMHAGQMASLGDVLAHYSAAPASPIGHSELRPARLSPRERAQIIAFLRTLSSPLTVTSR